MALRGLGIAATGLSGTYALKDLLNVTNTDFYNKALASGVIGSGTAYLPISYVDPTTPLISLAAGRWIEQVQIRILTAWDGVGARIRVGVLGDLARYADTDIDADIDTPLAYEIDIDNITGGVENIIITIDAGAGATQGTALVAMSF